MLRFSMFGKLESLLPMPMSIQNTFWIFSLGQDPSAQQNSASAGLTGVFDNADFVEDFGGLISRDGCADSEISRNLGGFFMF